LQNNNHLENANHDHQNPSFGWLRGQDLTLQLLMGLFRIGLIILAIGFAINQIRQSWFVGETISSGFRLRRCSGLKVGD
jgi:hypothetical protein